MADRKPLIFEIPEGTPHTRCRGCNAMIYWITTSKKKVQMPINPDGVSHFATCKNAAEFRRKK